MSMMHGRGLISRTRYGWIRRSRWVGRTALKARFSRLTGEQFIQELKRFGENRLIIFRQGLKLARQHFLSSEPGCIKRGLTVSGHFKGDLTTILAARFASDVTFGNQATHDPGGRWERGP